MSDEPLSNPEQKKDWCEIYTRNGGLYKIDCYSKHYGPTYQAKTSCSSCKEVNDLYNIFNPHVVRVPDLLFLNYSDEITLIHSVTTVTMVSPPTKTPEFHLFGSRSLLPSDNFVSLDYRDTQTLLSRTEIEIPKEESFEWVERKRFNNVFVAWNNSVLLNQAEKIKDKGFSSRRKKNTSLGETKSNGIIESDTIPLFNLDKTPKTYKVLPFVLCPPSLTYDILSDMKLDKELNGGWQNSYTPTMILYFALKKAKELFKDAFVEEGVKPNRGACEMFLKYMTPIASFCWAATNVSSCSLPALSTDSIPHPLFREQLRTNWIARHASQFSQSNHKPITEDMEAIAVDDYSAGSASFSADST